jgi:hypothetical protein
MVINGKKMVRKFISKICQINLFYHIFSKVGTLSLTLNIFSVDIFIIMVKELLNSVAGKVFVA